MTPIYSRRVPHTWFLGSGIFRPHYALLNQALLYTVLAGSFVAVLFRLGQFTAVPWSLQQWSGLETGLSAPIVPSGTLASLAQIKTVIILTLTIFIVFSSLFRRIGMALARWCIDEAYARRTRNVFLQLDTQTTTRETRDLLQLMPEGDSTLSSYLAFQRLIQNTTLISQDSPAGIMEAVRDTTESEARQVAGAQKLLLHLGILGTFIGLMFAAPSLNFILDEHASDQQIAVGLQNLFTSLATCFTTSIAGLLGSIAVGGGGGILRRMHEKHLRSLEDALLTVQAVATDALLQKAGQSDFGAIWHALHLQNDRLQAQTETLRKGMADLGDLKSVFAAVEIVMTAAKTQMAEVGRVFSGQELAGALSTAIKDSVHTSLQQQSEGNQKVSGALDATVKTLTGLKTAIEEQRAAARAEAADQRAAAKAELELLQATCSKLGADMLERVRSDNTQIMGASMERLNQKLAELHEEIRAHERALRFSPGYRLMQWICALPTRLKRLWSRPPGIK